MKDKVFIKILFIIFVFSFISILPNIVHADSLTVSSSKYTANSGETVTVTINTDCIGRFNISCSNGTTKIDRLWLEKSSDSFEVTVGKSGTTTITVTPEKVSTASGAVASLGSQSITININSTQSSSSGSSSQNSGNTGNSSDTNSSNANLSNLGLVTYDFKGFKPYTSSYNATVPNEVTSVEVYAITQAKGAKYSVSGNTNLEVGTNKITITVTAPDGKTKKTYYIYVARQSAGETEVVPNVIEETEEDKEKTKLGLTSIAIDDEYEIYLNPEFKTDIYEYTINLKEDLTTIPLTAIANKENAKVDIEGNEDLKDGENIITITVTDEETNETVKYTIKVNKEKEPEDEVLETTAEIVEEDNKNTDSNNNLILICTAIVLILLIIISIIIYKVKNRNYDEDLEEYYEKDENKTEEDEQKSEQEDNIVEKIEDYDNRIKAKRGKHKGKHF